MSTRFIQGSPVNYQGRSDNSAVPTGYIGQNKKATVLPGANQSLTTGYVAITGASLSLEAGVWFIFANVSYEGVSSPTQVSLELYDGAAQVTFNECTITGGGAISLGHAINASSTTSYSLRTKAASALGSVSGFNRPQFIAVRIG